MLQLRIDRINQNSHGTFGLISGDTVSGTYWTCEEEQQHNLRNISCIPAGTYLCKRTIYHRHGYETFEVVDVQNRTRILFHPGNTEEDTDGCILIGYALGALWVESEDTGRRVRKLAVLQSQAAFDVFMDKLRGVDEFELTIVDPEE